jgi:hypothetical protein
MRRRRKESRLESGLLLSIAATHGSDRRRDRQTGDSLRSNCHYPLELKKNKLLSRAGARFGDSPAYNTFTL